MTKPILYYNIRYYGYTIKHKTTSTVSQTVYSSHDSVFHILVLVKDKLAKHLSLNIDQFYRLKPDKY